MSIALRRPQSLLPAIAVLALGALFVDAIATITVLAYVWRGEVLTDWPAFYSAGTLVRTGDAAHLYDASVQAATQHRLFGEGYTPFGYALPAFVAFLFAPLSWLSFAQSYFVWLAINVALLAALVRLSWSWLSELPAALRAVFLACATSIAVLVAVLAGQVDLFVLSGFAACYALLRSGRPFAGGSMLALALVKPHLAIALLLLLLVKRQWRALGGFAAVAAPLLVVPPLLSGPALLADQARLLVSYTNSDTAYRVNAESMINIRGAVSSVTGSSDVWLWLPLLVVIAAVALYVAVRVWLELPALHPQSWALAFALPLLYSPHVHVQTIVLLLGATALFLAADRSSAQPRADVQHVLLAFVAFTVIWMVSFAGVALMAFAVMGTYALFVRGWPASAAQPIALPQRPKPALSSEPPRLARAR